MKCEELLQALNDYVDGDIDPGVCDAFQAHLADCNPCQIVIDNIRKTITLYKDKQPVEMPPEVCQKLREALRKCWEQRFPRSPR